MFYNVFYVLKIQISLKNCVVLLFYLKKIYSLLFLFSLFLSVHFRNSLHFAMRRTHFFSDFRHTTIPHYTGYYMYIYFLLIGLRKPMYIFSVYFWDQWFQKIYCQNFWFLLVPYNIISLTVGNNFLFCLPLSLYVLHRYFLKKFPAVNFVSATWKTLGVFLDYTKILFAKNCTSAA